MSGIVFSVKSLSQITKHGEIAEQVCRSRRRVDGLHEEGGKTHLI
jgi:hypothetical protein